MEIEIVEVTHNHAWVVFKRGEDEMEVRIDIGDERFPDPTSIFARFNGDNTDGGTVRHAFPVPREFDSETHCHCGGEYKGADHCRDCGCEQYQTQAVRPCPGRWA